jgi:MFS family permease
VVLGGLLLVMAWSSMASPALFAVVADTLPRGRRAIGFTMQALLRRLPMVIAPILGGLTITRFGAASGTRFLLAMNIVLAAAAFMAIRAIRVADIPFRRGAVVRFPRGLKVLLAADIFARICEGLVDVFIVLYVMRFVTASQFGLLVAIQSLTSMVVYLPAARLAGKGIVLATFLAFAFFPLAIVSASSFSGLVAAFVMGGLREIGEPSRKSMIVDFAHDSARARTVGAYYFLRSVTIAPSASLGALLWSTDVTLPFHAAFAAGLLGAAIFAFVRMTPAAPSPP